MVDTVSVDSALPHAEPAPWAGRTSVASGRSEQPVERVVELRAEVLGGHVGGHEQVGSADVADEQGVAGQHGHRIGARRRGARRARSTRACGRAWASTSTCTPPRSITSPSASGGTANSVVPAAAEADLGAGRGGQLEVAGQEVGVEVGLDDELDRQALVGGGGEDLVDVAAGVDGDRPPGACASPTRYDACDRQPR